MTNVANVESVVGDLRVAAYASILDVDHRLQAVDGLVARARTALVSDRHDISLPEMVAVIDEATRQLSEASEELGRFEKLLGIRRQHLGREQRNEPEREAATSLRGSAESMPIPDLITFLSTQQKTGTVRIETADTRYLLELLDGAVVHAMCDAPTSGQRLGSLLVAKGALSVEKLEAFLADHSLASGEIGSCLVRARIVSEDDLRDALEEQVRNLFTRIFGLTDATFAFVEGAVSDLELRVSLNAMHLLLDSARQSDEWVAQLEEAVREEPCEPSAEPAACGNAHRRPLEDVVELRRSAIEALRAAGYGDLSAVETASDDDLLEVFGVGPRTVELVRTFLARTSS